MVRATYASRLAVVGYGPGHAIRAVNCVILVMSLSRGNLAVAWRASVCDGTEWKTGHGRVRMS